MYEASGILSPETYSLGSVRTQGIMYQTTKENAYDVLEAMMTVIVGL
jgi:hypothetical protein